MGGYNSKPKPTWVERTKERISDEVYQRAMIQREIQMSVNIAKARDTIQIFGTAWLTLVSGVVIAKLAKKPVPGILGVPVVVGGIVLGNMADMAYGNKLQRVCREAEYIMEFEKERFVPFKQAPFEKYYTQEQKAAMYDIATPVGEMYPSAFWARPTKN